MLSTVFSFVVLALVGLLVYLGRRFIQIQHERDRLKQDLRRYESLTSREETEKQLDSNIQLKQNELQELEIQRRDLRNSIDNLQTKFRELEAKDYLISVNNYENKYDFVDSKDYFQRLKQVELEQQKMRSKNQAFICETSWSVGEGKTGQKQGKQITDGILKTIKFAFEELCKYALKEVSYNNFDTTKNKIIRAFETINKGLKKIDCRISEYYLDLKIKELILKYEFEDKKQQEKEKEQEIKQQARERKNIETARRKAKEAEMREKNHQKELDKIRQELEQVAKVEIERREQLELKIQQLEQKVSEDRKEREQANRVKWGYIYVLSNIGSFRGDNVYRICMTNRNKPEEYIRNMNPAVPFRFDVHFEIFSEDVYDTLERLHSRFNNRRINTVNTRRDFFKVSLDEIKQAVQEIKEETGVLRIENFEPEPKAYEYRQTIAERKNSGNFDLEEDALN